MNVAIPVHMRRGIFGRMVPFIIMAGKERTAFLPIDKKLYERITAPCRQATYLDRLAGTMHVFSEYADGLVNEPLEALLQRYPGSWAVENRDVESFSLYVGRDSSTGRLDDHYTFEIRCRRGKYKGSVDKGTNAECKAGRLREIFGERFKMDPHGPAKSE
ncbi:MAG TPA: hypothetical protein GX500_04400 [Firmicutes bacterium]|nr:hypothetical protein [Candidatus Fermentithermobacillaceae bacterium]